MAISAHTPNRLIKSTSPYLLQHAYNPVDWYEWGDEALLRAKAEDKPILVSIGYSSCHWCHVMERECFEKEAIAIIMNEHFVCIKVDREERPDVDQLYMDAVQAMGINGGWPLNVFLTPDQKPFYGGTYFPPPNWTQMLKSLHVAYTSRRHDVEESAESLAAHLSRSDINRFKQAAPDAALDEDLKVIYQKLERRFDKTWGGLDKAPKFIMPSIWLWMLRYHHLTGDVAALEHTVLTLKKIGMGGIYDQIGGGFARYSVDGEWFAPHFEKMLYDNAQLLSLYGEAYTITGDDYFKQIIANSFGWIQREMTNENGGFYSALDADSEGVEGKFYCWTANELDTALSHDAHLIKDFYSCTAEGNWEHGMNILFVGKDEAEFMRNHHLTPAEWTKIHQRSSEMLMRERATRIRPALDDKIITGWNAMMVCGLIDAYRATGDDKLLHAAVKNLTFLKQSLFVNGRLMRSYKGKASGITAFLDDHAYVILACVKVYEVSFDESWLTWAAEMVDHVISDFYDDNDGYFLFSAREVSNLIATRKEIFDNVIPSSNALMAQALFKMGTLMDRHDWKDKARTMAQGLGHLILTEPNYMTHWATVWLEIRQTFKEVSIVGPDALNWLSRLNQYQPFVLSMGTLTTSTLPLLTDKVPKNHQTALYVCRHNTCSAPATSIEAAMRIVNTKD